MQEIITKCLKQFDMRLFEEIGGNDTKLINLWNFYKAGKFAKDWKKSLKIVSLEKNLAL